MYKYKTSKYLDKILSKLLKKNKELYEQVLKKIEEIINSSNIEHYKNLRYNLKNLKRTHIGPFVLVFEFIKSENLIVFEDLDHHDKIYKGK